MALDDITQLAVVQSLKANSYGISTQEGASVATSQYHRVLMLVNVGTAAGSSSWVVKLQDSDDNSTWTDVSGATTGTLRESTGDDEQFYFGGALTQNLKKYVRAHAQVAGAACNLGVQLVLQPRDTADSSTAIFNV